MGIVADIGLAGLRAAQTRFAARAENIANVNSSDFTPARVEQTSTAVGPVARVTRPEADRPDNRGPAVDLATEIVDALAAKRDFEASAQIVRAEKDLNDNLLDIIV